MFFVNGYISMIKNDDKVFYPAFATAPIPRTMQPCTSVRYHVEYKQFAMSPNQGPTRGGNLFTWVLSLSVHFQTTMKYRIKIILWIILKLLYSNREQNIRPPTNQPTYQPIYTSVGFNTPQTRILYDSR